MTKPKRTWQIGMRRYLIEHAPSFGFSKYYGISQKGFKKYIENQFANGMSWGNYASVWDFDHLIPICYFDTANKEDMQLCWNFLNIQASRLPNNGNKSARVDVSYYREYFTEIYLKTNYDVALKMANKISEIEKIMRESVSLSQTLAFMETSADDWETFYNFLDYKRIM